MQNFKKKKLILLKRLLPRKHNLGIFNQNAYILIFYLHLRNIKSNMKNKRDYTAIGYSYQHSTSQNSKKNFI